MSQAPITPIAYRIGDLAVLLSMSRSAAYRLVQSGELRPIRIGHSLRVLQADLDDYLAGQRRDPPR